MNLDEKNEIDIFLQLFDAEWHNRATAPALNNLSFRKHNKPEVLPLTEDLFEVRKYIVERINFLTKKVNKSVGKENWGELAEVTLFSLITFNKRRSNYQLSLSILGGVKMPE